MNRRSFLEVAGFPALAAKLSRASSAAPINLKPDRTLFRLSPATSKTQWVQGFTTGGDKLYSLLMDPSDKSFTISCLDSQGTLEWSRTPPSGHYFGLRALPSGDGLVTLRDAGPAFGGQGFAVAQFDPQATLLQETHLNRGIVDFDVAGGNLFSYWLNSAFDVRSLQSPGKAIKSLTPPLDGAQFVSVMAINESMAFLLDREMGRFAACDIQSDRTAFAGKLNAPEISAVLESNATKTKQLKATPTPAGMRVYKGRPTAIAMANVRRSTGTVFAALGRTSMQTGALLFELSSSGSIVNRYLAALPDRPASKYKVPFGLAFTSKSLILVYSDAYASSYPL